MLLYTQPEDTNTHAFMPHLASTHDACVDLHGVATYDQDQKHDSLLIVQTLLRAQTSTHCAPRHKCICG